MELMQEVKGYSDSKEEEEEEEAITGEDSCRLHQQDGGSNLANHGEGKQQQQQQHRVDHMMELSLGRNRGEVVQEGSASCSCSINTLIRKEEEEEEEEEVEKEHMFEKVVTPSDVGKLNRLVIPKQYAEKYFPLDSSSNEKGLLLNFEDRNGKVWRFRYSYWNSSQSYVMTKGWSRFVKEKKLDAGDIVSFHRGIGDLYRHRLYIDWRRRPPNFPSNSSLLPNTPLFPFLPNNNNNFHPTRLYPFPSTSSTQYLQPRYPPPHHLHNLHYNNNNFYTLHQHQYHAHDHLNSLYYLTSPTPPDQYFPAQQQDRGNINNVPMIIDSVPVAHHHHRGGGAAARPGSNNTTTTTTTGKRLRLFGVNMECASSPASSATAMPNSSLQRMGLPREDPLSSSARFGDQRGATTSVLFDLDPTSQYRQ